MMEMVEAVRAAKEALSRTTPDELRDGLIALAAEKILERSMQKPPPKKFIERYVANGYTPHQAFTVYYEAIGAALGVYELPASLILTMEETWQSFSTPSKSNTTLTPAS